MAMVLDFGRTEKHLPRAGMAYTCGEDGHIRVLWTLTEHVGSMAKSDLARRLQTRQTELDVVLQELERAGKVKLTEIKGKLVVGLRDGRLLPMI
jgi:hypothetical protein